MLHFKSKSNLISNKSNDIYQSDLKNWAEKIAPDLVIIKHQKTYKILHFEDL